MTIALSANTPRISYTVAEGVTRTTPFNTDFIFFETSDISVFVDGVARTFDATTANTTQFTVSGGNGSTGSVTTTVTGATGGSTVVITRDIELKRTTDFPSSGAFEISKLNTELDTIIAITSDFNDSASRAIRLQDFDSAVSMELPLLASRKGTVLGFNATTGAVEAGPTITAVQSLADVTASINLLGTSDAVSDMNLLATSANVTAMGHLGTSANVTAMGLLGTSSNVTAMGKLGNDATVADMALLGTDATVADMAQLANSTIIDDLAQLANTTITDDMAILATTANVANMATLGASGVVGNIATVAGIQGNVTTVAGVSGNVTTVAGISTDVTAVAGVSSNVTTVAGVASNVTTVANNVTGVNSFAERYRVASSAPTSSLDVGDLYFDTTANELKVYKSSGWAAAGSTVNGTSGRFTYNITGTPTTLTGASGTGFAEANGATLAYDAGFIDVYLNGVKQVNGTDVTVTSGTSVVFASALSNGDVVDIVTFGTFNVAAINADNINSGTVPVARVSGSYTSITGTGALNAGSITSGFGNIDTGSSTITTTGAISGGTLTGTLQTAAQTNITSVGTLTGLTVSGDIASSTSGSNNFRAGVNAGNSIQSGGDDNTCVGDEAGTAITTGDKSVVVGYRAGDAITTGSSNIAIGRDALGTETTGNKSVAIGTGALETQNFTGGADSLNVAVGDNAGKSITTGQKNVFIGALAGQDTTDDDHNTFVGYSAGGAVNGGFRNTFIGKDSGDAMTTGDKNVIIGSYGGNEGSLDIRTSDQYIVLSDGDGNPRQITTNTGHTGWPRDLSDSDRANNTNYHAIHNTSNTHPALVVEHSGDSAPNGIFIDFSDADPDNTSQWFIKAEGSTGAERFKVLSNGNTLNANDVFGAISDEKLKEQIKDATSQWNDIKALKIRKYKFKTDVAKGDSDEHWRLGVIAQELETSGMSGLVMDIPDMIENKDGENVESETTTKSVKTSVLHMKAVKALQEAMARIETLEAKVTALESA